MLNKRSEVEIRVAQELKNNQDFIYATNQTLQVLKMSLIELSTRLENMVHKQNETISKIEISIERQNLYIKKTVRDQSALIDSYGVATAQFAEESINAISSMMQKSDKIDQLSTFVDGFVSKQGSMNLMIDAIKSKMETIESRMKGHIADVVDVLRKEFPAMIPDTDPLKKDLLYKMDLLYIDLASFVKELNVLKKKIDYGEKKFENIYTLIERLKAGKNEPSR